MVGGGRHTTTVTLDVYRAPMRSRRDDVDAAAAVARALRCGICGIGGRLDAVPATLAAAVEAVAVTHDARTAARLERFAAVPDGSFVWTRDGDGSYFLGRFAGPWRYDPDPEAWTLDLVHVRATDWAPDPVPPDEVPPATRQTFARGGRNFQRTRDPQVGAQTLALWRARGGP